MDGKMKVAVMKDIRKIEMEERKIPSIKADEVLVKIDYVGICGSDIHFLEAGRIGNMIVDEPLILGHESGGVVVEVGAEVKDLIIGDRVALEPGVPCGVCDMCKAGLYNLCGEMSFMAVPHERDGVFLEYCAHPANMCFKLPENVDTMEGGLMEPLSVGLHAVNISNAKMGQSAVVLGCGCIGLVTIMALKAAGIDEIYAVDVISKRLEKAQELGAIRVINGKEEDAVAVIKELTGGVDQVYETAGSEFTTLQSTKMIKKGGNVTLVGMCPNSEIKIDIGSLSACEGKINTVFRYRNLYPMAIKLVSQGKIPLKSIVSHVFDFKDIIEGIDFNINHKEEVIKAVIKM
ncbi:MAG: NAD(P)-dependent alcohol dehydrogenase [Lachnospiraceae bacterium]|nr:NAD(P)-dependent alcohol dehydrogenase [Lachnospiraceae bacterium]